MSTNLEKLNHLMQFAHHWRSCRKTQERLMHKPEEQCVCDCGLDAASLEIKKILARYPES